MNKTSIKNGLIHLICRETECRNCLFKNHNCLDASFNDVVAIARENYHDLVKKYERTIFINKDERMAMEFLKGAKME